MTANTPALDEQIAEVAREIRNRERLYPAWISKGIIQQVTADDKLADLRAALKTLEFLRAVNPYIPERLIGEDDAEQLLKHPEVRTLLEAFPEAVLVDGRPLPQREAGQ